MEKEVAAALESVIPRAALSPFMMLNNTQKVTQLTELNNLVLGIRLFNKEIGKGGVSVNDIGQLLEKIDNEFLEKIRVNLIDTVGLTEKYAFYFESKLAKYEELDSQDKVLKTELMFLRQYTSLLMNLMEKVESSVGICESAEGRYLKETADLKTLLGSKSSAPKEQVYPKFAVLANSYLQIFEESKHAKDKIELFELLKSIFDSVKFSLTRLQQSRGESYSNELRRKREQNGGEESEEEQEIIAKNNVVYIEPKHTPEFLQIPLDILGFCIVTLVETKGLLMPGQHTFGVFKFKENSLIFRSVEEAKRFIEKPNYYLEEFFRLCREFPQMILLLRVDDVFRELGLTLIHVDPEQKGKSTKIMLDSGAQTADHYDKFIDHNYCWNEWELRRKAIQMANIRNMTTTGTQTADSIYKVENQSQVWLMKDSSSQTGINNGNNPIRPRNYITDLRDKTNQ